MTTNVLNTKIGEVENKTLNVSGLVTAVVLNPKIGKVEDKIPDVSSLVKKTDYQTMKENISLQLIIINLWVTYLIQR